MRTLELVAQLAVAALALYVVRNTQVAVQFGYRTEPDGDEKPTSQNVGFVMQTVTDDDDEE